jgi:hypothetical protein
MSQTKEYTRVGDDESPTYTYEYFQTAPDEDNDLGEVIAIATNKETGNKHLLKVNNNIED